MTATTALTTRSAAELAEQVAIAGDLSKLSPEQRMQYYSEVCKSVGLNPLTRPFQYIQLNGKLTLYTTRDATDQLRRLQGVSIAIVSRERIEDVYVVTARATTQDGRSDESTGAVSLGGLKGESLANALMKAETKAKRRVTLSICGLGWLDESELDTVRDARPVGVDATTGELLDHERLLTQVLELGKQITQVGRWLDGEKPKMGELRRMSVAELAALAEVYAARLGAPNWPVAGAGNSLDAEFEALDEALAEAA